MSSDLLQLKAVSLPNCTWTYNTIIPLSRVAAFVLFPHATCHHHHSVALCPLIPSLLTQQSDRIGVSPLLRPEERAANAARKEKKCNIVRKMLFLKDEVGCLIKAGWAAKKSVVEIMEGLTFKVSACLELNEVKSCCGSKKNVCSIYQGQ